MSEVTIKPKPTATILRTRPPKETELGEGAEPFGDIVDDLDNAAESGEWRASEEEQENEEAEDSEAEEAEDSEAEDSEAEDSEEQEPEEAEEQEPAPKISPPSRARGKKKAPRRRAAPKNKSIFGDDLVEASYKDIIGRIAFGPDQHKISVHRLEPHWDEDGNQIKGLCGTFTYPIEQEDVQKKYGGGKFRLTIQGPRPDGSWGPVKFFNIEIAGPPKSMTKKKEDPNSGLTETVHTILETSSKMLEQAQMEAREERKNTAQILQAALTKKPDSSGADSLALITKASEERAEREANLRREEKKEEDQRRREEAERRREEKKEEEQRRREEAERRREEKKEEEQRRREEKKEEERRRREERQEDLKLQMQQMEINAKRTEVLMTMGMKLFETMTDQKNSNASAAAESQKAMFETLTKVQSDNQSRFDKLTHEMLKNANQKSDPLESIDKMLSVVTRVQKVAGVGPEEDNRPAWERGIDKVMEAVQPVAQVMMSRGAQPQYQEQAQQHQGPAPGAVAVVEGIDQFTGLPAPEPQPASQPNPQQMAEPQIINPDGSVEPSVETEGSVEGITEFVVIPPDADLETQFKLLVQNLELAMQRGAGAEDIYEHIIKKLPPAPLAILKAADVDTILEKIEEKAPPDWLISSMKGDAVLRKMHRLLKEGSE